MQPWEHWEDEKTRPIAASPPLVVLAADYAAAPTELGEADPHSCLESSTKRLLSDMPSDTSFLAPPRDCSEEWLALKNL